VLQLVEDWLREEHPFLLREQPWAHATLIVAGNAVAGRLPTIHVTVAAPAAAGTGLPSQLPRSSSIRSVRVWCYPERLLRSER
jgi:hypothetical protein